VSKTISEPMYVWRKLGNYLAMKLTLSQKDRNEILHDPRHLGVPSGAPKMVSEAMERLVQTVDLSCTDTNTISKWTISPNGPSSIDCVQIDFRAYGTFGANRAPIFNQD
jgi:hypothetical protein